MSRAAIISSFIIAFMCCPVMWGVSDDKDDKDSTEILELYRKISDLEKNINKINKELSDSCNENKSLRKKFAKLNKDYDNLKGKKKKIEKERDGLKDNVDSLENVIKVNKNNKDKEFADSLKKKLYKIDSLNSVIEYGVISQDLLRREIDSLRTQVTGLGDQLAKLEVIKRIYMDQLAGLYDANWSSKLLSQVDLTTLGRDIDECNQYAHEDSRIAAAAAKLDELRKNCLIYKRCDSTVHSPYVRSDVSNAVAGAGQIKGRLTAQQVEEVDNVIDILKKYRTGVAAFQNLISNMDKATADYETHELAKNFVNIQLKEDRNVQYMEQIKPIPWLNEQLEAYMDDLKEDCKAASKPREKVMSLSIQ